MDVNKTLSRLVGATILTIVGPLPAAIAQSDDYSGEFNTNTGAFEDATAFLSAPRVGPAYACTSALSVDSVFPGATIEVKVNGTLVKTVVASFAPFQVTLPSALVAAQNISVTQKLGTVTSQPGTRTVEDWATINGPLPTPELMPPVLFECGRRLGAMGAIPGATIQFFIEAGKSGGGWELEELAAYVVADHNGTGWVEPTIIGLPANGIRYKVRQTLCGSASAFSDTREVLSEPTTLPAPRVVEVVGNRYRQYAILDNLLPGARVEAFVEGVAWTEHNARWSQDAVLLESIPDGVLLEKTFTFRQSFCGSPSSESQPVDAADEHPPSSGCNFRAPSIRPPRVGDQFVEVIDGHPDARVRVYANSVEIGDGGGRFISLSRAILQGDVLAVVQIDPGGCGENERYFEYVVGCRTVDLLDPRKIGNDLAPTFSVGYHDFESDDSFELSELTDIPVKGRIWYPAVQPGKERAPAVADSAAPVILLSHGVTGLHINYTPEFEDPIRCEPFTGSESVDAFLGYWPVAESLAERGFVVISVDVSALNCRSGVPAGTDLLERTAYVIETLKFLYKDEHDDEFLDVLRPKYAPSIGLFGHSRGGEAVVRAVADCAAGCGLPSGVSIGSILTLGATSGGWARNGVTGDWEQPNSSVSEVPAIDGISTLVITPAADGEVVSLEGMRHYDRAIRPTSGSWFKSHFFVRGALHRPWNYRLVPESTGVNSSTLLAAERHVKLLDRWALAFYLTTLMSRSELLPLFVGDAKLSQFMDGVTNEVSALTSSMEYVDDFEDEDATKNLLNQSISESPAADINAGEGFLGESNPFYGNHTNAVTLAWSDPATYSSAVPQRAVSQQRMLSFRLGHAAVPTTGALGQTNNNLQLGVQTSAGAARVTLNVVDGLRAPPHSPDIHRPDLYMRTIRVPFQCLRISNEPIPTNATMNAVLVYAGDTVTPMVVDDVTLE